MPDLIRCAWTGEDDELMLAYHDTEWGTPLHDDRALFELLTLEGAQAGRSWRTVLHRREGYRRVFEGFDLPRLAAWTDADQARALQDVGIIRNRAKVAATVGNAQAALAAIEEHGSLDAYLWSFAGGVSTVNGFTSMSELPAETDVSKAMSKALKKAGFRFVGPTICYAFMEATGMVNDHTTDCFRYNQV
ncbi:MAG: DNA-3-methyladenine glycosylase I [Chloroflexi bacterium]|nr:DNA-3-methyladenine glycosylase I [Chloroflexota bacterium]MDA1145358.1 DNA-3-methyladenine glycosylase I [Chloroflexota bacterium]